MKPMRRHRKAHEDATSVMWKDFVANLSIVFMVLMGGLNMLAPAAAPDAGRSSLSSETVQLYIGESDGALYFGSPHTAPVSADEIVERVTTAAHNKKSGTVLPVIVHHTPYTPSLYLFNAVSPLGKVSGIKTLLALSEYTTGQTHEGRTTQ